MAEEFPKEVLLTFEAPQQCETCGNVTEKVITLAGRIVDYAGLWRITTEEGITYLVPKHAVKIIQEVKNGR